MKIEGCIALVTGAIRGIGEAAARDCGDVSLLINNAGPFANKLLIGATDMTAARQEMEVNYFGPLTMCRALAPVLARNGGGAVPRTQHGRLQPVEGGMPQPQRLDPGRARYAGHGPAGNQCHYLT